MHKVPDQNNSAFFNPRTLLAFALCAGGLALAVLSVAAPAPSTSKAGGANPEGSLLAPAQVPLSIASDVSNDPLMARLGVGTLPRPGLGVPALQSPPATGWNAPGNIGMQNTIAAGSINVPLGPSASGGWAIVPSANRDHLVFPFEKPINYIYDVACSSASDCWAVGTFSFGTLSTDQALIMRWNGTSWSPAETPVIGPNRSVLRGVTCLSASDCWAAGYYFDGSYNQTLIQHWDGNQWSVVPSANTSSTQHNVLLGNVACTSASDCWAVGAYYTGSVDQTLIQHWDGTAWSVVLSPNADFTQHNDLYNVTCTSASDCWAVGRYVNSNGVLQTLVEHWNGTSWSLVNSPNTSNTQSNVLFNVTCASASDCWIVGAYSENGTDRTLIQHWNGTAWSIVASPNTAPGEHNDLLDVACTSASNCWAVGGFFNGQYEQTLIQHWDGTDWSIEISPNSSRSFHIFFGIACTSGSQCHAVGYRVPETQDQVQTLAAQWDGIDWTIEKSSNRGSMRQNYLPWGGVTCVSPTDCWAVGYGELNSTISTMTQHWDGKSWTLVPSPNVTRNNVPGDGDGSPNVLNAVDCISTSDCWAVGYHFGLGGNETLTMHWDGTAWTVVPSPITGMNQWNVLTNVTCTSTSDCWAVGYNAGTTNSLRQSLFLRWNGTAWSIVPSVTPPTRQHAEIYDVECSSPSSCWAVGYYTVNNIQQTLIDRWDGAAWVPVPSPAFPPTNSNLLIGVTCVSASDCWAVGQMLPAGGVNQNMFQHWDGIAWTNVPAPNTSPTQPNYLFGVDCTSSSNCWAVGEYHESGVPQTLILQWDGTSWAIVNSPNRMQSNGAPLKNFLRGVECASASMCFAVGHYNNNFFGNDNGYFNQTLIEQFTIPVELMSVVSRKIHGSEGPFDIDLPLSGAAGIECRSGGVNGNYQIVFRFANALTSVGSASVSTGIGSVSSSSIDNGDAKNYVVNLTGVSNAQTIKVDLASVADSVGHISSRLSASMTVLVGDVTGNGSVNSSDIGQAKSNSGLTSSSSNFRADVTANGVINSSDIGTIKSQSGTMLP